MKRIICLSLGAAFALVAASCAPTETIIIEKHVAVVPPPAPKPKPKPAPAPSNRAEDFEPIGKPQ